MTLKVGGGGGRAWDGETVLRTLEIVDRISCRRAAWHPAAATLTSRKGPRAQSWKCWKFEPSVLPLRLCERPTVPVQGIAVRAGNWQAELKTSQFARIRTVSTSQAYPAFVSLAGHIGLGRFPLSVQRVELQLQAVFARFAGIDAAANCRLQA